MGAAGVIAFFRSRTMVRPLVATTVSLSFSCTTRVREPKYINIHDARVYHFSKYVIFVITTRQRRSVRGAIPLPLSSNSTSVASRLSCTRQQFSADDHGGAVVHEFFFDASLAFAAVRPYSRYTHVHHQLRRTAVTVPSYSSSVYILARLPWSLTVRGLSSSHRTRRTRPILYFISCNSDAPAHVTSAVDDGQKTIDNSERSVRIVSIPFDFQILRLKFARCTPEHLWLSL